jgi:hypothetical protein
VKDAAGHQVAKLDGLRGLWVHRAKCATPSFKPAGTHAALRVMVFHQKIGRTNHGCDGVAVPDVWRIFRF